MWVRKVSWLRNESVDPGGKGDMESALLVRFELCDSVAITVEHSDRGLIGPIGTR
jgi:hypothetical protein